MADQIPIKVLKAGSDTCGLAQFIAADTVGIIDGGTGLATQGICEFAQPGINAVACKSTYIGICAGKSEGAADENTYVGYGAGQNVTTGCYHTIIGSNAGDAITTCHSSVLIGYNAGTAITFGDFNTLIGTTAGAAVVTASNNTALGYSAATATICSNNVAVGTCAMVANTQGQDNVAIGLKAGATQVAAGCNNVFIGSCVGAVALCQDNTLVGAHAGVAQTTATGNVMLGVCVGYGVVGGAGNVYLGFKTGLVNTSGNNNVFIGNCAGVGSTASCCLIIGNGTCDLITGAFNTPSLGINAPIYSTLTVGVNDTGYDVTFFGATSGCKFLWDESADELQVIGTTVLCNTVTVGVNDTGHDVKFFGATAGCYFLWDESANTLEICGTDITLNGTSVLNSPWAISGCFITTPASCFVGVGTTAPASVLDVRGTVQVGVNDTGHDVTFFGATSGCKFLWDESADQLQVIGTTVLCNTLTVGVDDTGYDVKLFGASAGAFMLYDESADTLDVRGATAAGPGVLKLTTGELTNVDGGILGRLEFQAPLDSAGTDAILVAASIWAEADATFSSSVNTTDLVFATATSATAAEQMRLTSGGCLGIATTAPASLLDVRGTVQVGVDDTGYDVKFFGDTASRYWLWDTDADGVVQRGTLTVGVSDTGHDVTFFGATAGCKFLWDESADTLILCGAAITTGASVLCNTLTVGVDDTGYDVKFFGASAGAFMLYDESANTLDVRGATAAGPGVLKLTTGELTNVDGGILGRLEFQAPLDSAGTDAILVAASIWGEADGTFAAACNKTDLVFATANSETATEKMRITSTGYVGIGTTSPAYLLEVEKDQNATTAIAIDNNTAGTAALARLRVSANAGETTLTTFSSSYTTSSQYIQDSSLLEASGVASLGYSTTGSGIPHIWYGNDAEMMRLVSGNLGIGTATVGALLHLNKSSGDPDIQFSIGGTDKYIFGVDDSDGDYLKISVGGTLGANVGEYGFFDGYAMSIVAPEANEARFYLVSDNGDDVNDAWRINSDGGKLEFEARTSGTSAMPANGDTWTERMQIDTSGNVGIGVTPVYHVHSLLTGSAVQTNLVIDNAQAAADGVGSAIVFVGHTGGQNMATVQSSWTAGTNCGARLQFRTRQSGTETTTMTLDESGNVGIGTASPGAGLDVAYSGTDAAFRVYNSQATNPLGLLVDNTGGNSSDGNYVASYRVGGTAVFQIMNSGNVGIGTTGPGASLHIYKDMAAPDDLGDWDNYQLVIQGGSATGCAAGILLASSIDTYGGSAMVHYDTGSNGKGDLVFYTKQAESASAPTEVMRLDDAGKVGIGTTAPASILHIEQSPLDYLTMTSAGVTIARLGNVVSSACIGDLSLYHNGNRCARIVADTGDSFISGKFGIGTGAPEDNFNIYSSSNIVMRLDSQVAASGSTAGPSLELALTGGTGDPGQAGDTLGTIQFDGQANDNEFAGAKIQSKVVVGATTRSAMSTNLEFSTMCAGEAGANNVRMTIDPNGAVLRPYQPAFLTRQTTNQLNVTGDATFATVDFGTETFDKGGNLSGSTFTAPVTGTYQFTAHVRPYGLLSTHTYGLLYFVTSNDSYTVWFGDPYAWSSGGEVEMAGTMILDMDAADTAYIQIYVANGTKVVDVAAGVNTTFAGYLIA